MGQGGHDALRAVGPLASWVPAGWYPDPIGQGVARYWDGSAWTERYRDAPGPEPIPSSPGEVSTAPAAPTSEATSIAPPTGPTGTRPSLLRNKWLWGLVAALVLIVVIAAVAGSNKSSSPTSETTPSSPAAQATPSAELHLNQGSFSTTGSQATLTGTVTPGATVTVNEQPASVHGDKWSKTVRLHIGENNLEIKASLTGRESAEEQITITYHTEAEIEQGKREAREKRESEEREQREHQEIEHATVSQQNALKEAESYLQSSAFSETGLIEQLSSEAGSGFPRADAVWAVEHLHVNWNEQAVKEAESYLHTSSFSCQGLIEQLSSEAGSKFTVAQAEYGAKKVGLC